MNIRKIGSQLATLRAIGLILGPDFSALQGFSLGNGEMWAFKWSDGVVGALGNASMVHLVA